MSKQWIEDLTSQLKEKGRDAAESYGREQHRAGIIETQGKVFFVALVTVLAQDFGEIRRQLQGSAIASETLITNDGPAEVKLTRSRFPWFDARLRHDGSTITLDYAQERGTAPDRALEGSTERKLVHFNFEVDRQDRLAVAESFGDSPRQFDQPEDLARHIIELLFTL